MFDAPLPKDRKLASIADKLAVIAFYVKLEKQKERAIEILRAPKLVGADSKEAKASREQQIKWARDTRRINIQKACQEKFPLTVGNATVCKWKDTAKKESWHQLPIGVAQRSSATTNSWRQQLGLPMKGQKIGGRVPISLQRELDLLIAEHAHGASEVSERREVVTTEHVVPWHVDYVVDWFPC